MNTATERTTRQKWGQFVAQRPEEGASEHRRCDRRRDAGFGMAELVFTQDGREVRRNGRLLNVSESGLMVKQREAVVGGTGVLVQITCEGGEFLVAGRIVHCTETVGGYKIGVELQFDGEDGGQS